MAGGGEPLAHAGERQRRAAAVRRRSTRLAGRVRGRVDGGLRIERPGAVVIAVLPDRDLDPARLGVVRVGVAAQHLAGRDPDRAGREVGGRRAADRASPREARSTLDPGDPGNGHRRRDDVADEQRLAEGEAVRVEQAAAAVRAAAGRTATSRSCGLDVRPAR